MIEKLKEYYARGITKNFDFRYLSLEKLENSILYYYHDIIDAFKQDLNKGEFDTITTEIGMVLNEIRYFKSKLPTLMYPKKVKTGLFNHPSKGYIYPEPYGVVLIASPWNYPFNLALSPLVGAIAAGNTICIKVSDKTPNIKKAIAQVLSIFPDEYIHVVGDSKEERNELFNCHFDYAFYTGSNKIAQDLMAKQAKYLTPMTLELGGKSPCIVDEESEVEVAAKRIAWGKFLNSGQTCVAPDYVLVHASVKEAFVENLIKYTKEFNYVGDELKEDYVNLVNADALTRVKKLIKGEKVIFGGKATEKSLEPTILDDIGFDSKIMKEEVFAPILPLITYHNLDEAIDKIKTIDKPLAFYYFTTNKKKARKVINALSFGGGCINDTIMHISEHNLPFGGVGMSGMGSYHGKKSFDTFTHYKSVLVKHKKKEFNFKYPPCTEQKLKLIKSLFKIKTRG